MTSTNKIILTIIAVIVLILGLQVIRLDNKVASLSTQATTTLDVSSSTIKIAEGTSTIDVPLMNVLSFQQSQLITLSNLYCASNPTAENCAPAK